MTAAGAEFEVAEDEAHAGADPATQIAASPHWGGDSDVAADSLIASAASMSEAADLARLKRGWVAAVRRHGFGPACRRLARAAEAMAREPRGVGVDGGEWEPDGLAGEF